VQSKFKSEAGRLLPATASFLPLRTTGMPCLDSEPTALMKTLNVLAVLTTAAMLSASSGFAAPPSHQESRDFVEASNKSTKSSNTETSKSEKESDFATSKEIITRIVREDTDLALQARRFKISTVSGHVTITGRVKKAKQKEKIGLIAANVAGQANVDNQLTVK
jgi:osmotically-inducible protein OsmY